MAQQIFPISFQGKYGYVGQCIVFYPLQHLGIIGFDCFSLRQNEKRRQQKCRAVRLVAKFKNKWPVYYVTDCTFSCDKVAC